MKLFDVGVLGKIRSSKLAEFGICASEKGVYFFSYGLYDWVCNLSFEYENGDLVDFQGTIKLDHDALTKITNVFPSGDITVTRKKNELLLSQDTKKLYLSIKEYLPVATPPKSMSSRVFDLMGKLSQDIVNLTKMQSRAAIDGNIDSFLILTKDFVARNTANYIAVVRSFVWDFFPEKEPMLYIDSEILRLFPDPELYYNGESFKISSDNIFVIIPNIPPKKLVDFDRPFKLLAKEEFRETAQFTTGALISMVDLLNRLYTVTAGTTVLTFTAVPDGFQVTSSDQTSHFEYFISCKHGFLDGWSFCINGVILSNLRYLSCETFYARFTFANMVPQSIVFFSELEADYAKSQKVMLLGLMAKT